MNIEGALLRQGIWPICGVDEAGRGPLAGPVVAAAVVIALESKIRRHVKDSKRVSPSRREMIYELIMQSPHICTGVSMVDASTIDEINILQATLSAMKNAVSKLGIKPECALIDGNVSPDLPFNSIAVVKGDITEPSISAASIVAKVIRDRYMVDMDSIYPGYGFARHKGYPTPAHYAAIRKLGPSPIHRRSFKGVTRQH
ncbi:MAG: ribonuclease HII [Thermodesulfobacteriota bacterium]|nr:ribonuclease HII [Thermodesulfobacteriota bacterium]